MKSQGDNSTISDSFPSDSYATTPFDNNSKLPANYVGNDIYALSLAINSAYEEPKKGEFESTDQYNQRLAARDSTPLVGSLNINSEFAFKLSKASVVCKYNADSKTMNVTIDDKNSFTIRQGLQSDNYDANNGFGAQVQVQKRSAAIISLSIQNSKLLNLPTDHDKPNIALPMDVTTASDNESDIAVLVTCHLLQKKDTILVDLKNI